DWTDSTIGSGTVLPPKLTVVIRRGLRKRESSARAAFPRIPIRYVFTDPDVEPAIPPKNIKPTITTWRAGRQAPKSAVANPVVVRIETTVKVASANARPMPSSASKPPATIATAPRVIHEYRRNSALEA